MIGKRNLGIKNNKKGITLIALVITIIVLLILAGVSIAVLTGEDGILAKAQLAKEKHIEGQEIEEDNLEKLYSQILVATNDSAQITISIKDLKSLIKEEVQKEVARSFSWRKCRLFKTRKYYYRDKRGYGAS